MITPQVRKYVVYKSIYLIHSLSSFVSLLHPPLLTQEYLHTNLLAKRASQVVIMLSVSIVCKYNFQETLDFLAQKVFVVAVTKELKHNRNTGAQKAPQ